MANPERATHYRLKFCENENKLYLHCPIKEDRSSPLIMKVVYNGNLHHMSQLGEYTTLLIFRGNTQEIRVVDTLDRKSLPPVMISGAPAERFNRIFTSKIGKRLYWSAEKIDFIYEFDLVTGANRLIPKLAMTPVFFTDREMFYSRSEASNRLIIFYNGLEQREILAVAYSPVKMEIFGGNWVFIRYAFLADRTSKKESALEIYNRATGKKIFSLSLLGYKLGEPLREEGNYLVVSLTTSFRNTASQVMVNLIDGSFFTKQ